jgi:hypothetical protein
MSKKGVIRMNTNNYVTMVHPRQIVSKGLKGCSSTRTVMTFAQKNNVPSVWWSPARGQKILLVDWPKFRTIWNQAYNMKKPTTMVKTPTNYTGRNFSNNMTTPTPKGRATTKSTTPTFYGKSTNPSTSKTMNSRTYSKRTRRAA